jgi:hypothetical protein
MPLDAVADAHHRTNASASACCSCYKAVAPLAAVADAHHRTNASASAAAAAAAGLHVYLFVLVASKYFCTGNTTRRIVSQSLILGVQVPFVLVASKYVCTGNNRRIVSQSLILGVQVTPMPTPRATPLPLPQRRLHHRMLLTLKHSCKGCALYLLYWHKSTNTDRLSAAA